MKLIDGEKLIADLRRYGHETISVDGLEGLIDVMENVHESCKDADSISRQAAIDAVKKLLDCMLETDTIGFYEIENVLFEVPSVQPEYEPVTAEDFAKTMSENTLYSFIAWHNEAVGLMERQGFVICKKTIL